jgi:hypothetical protein
MLNPLEKLNSNKVSVMSFAERYFAGIPMLVTTPKLQTAYVFHFFLQGAIPAPAHATSHQSSRYV